ncbi:anti-sigma factor [Roseomonas sp. USHLN139]|uniref:anti-sigma factor n=1 Tax=Roseomonas sp. USHLN139 TaxID=3081298 RepID=UPI003B017B89
MTPAPRTPEETEALAGEYVLGTLEAGAARAVAADPDPALRAAIARWEARLAPLFSLAPPAAPPAGLWQRIEGSLAPAVVVPLPRGRSWLWPAWAAGASAVAAGLALFLWRQPAPPPQLMTVLLSRQDQPAWLVQAEGGSLRLAALNPQPAPEGRVLQLWALPQGATAPVSLGLIPPSGAVSIAPGRVAPGPGMLIEITLEPPGGSPNPRPSGPILFIGRLTAAGQS